MKTYLLLAVLFAPTATFAVAHDGEHPHVALTREAATLVAEVEAHPPLLPQTLVFEFADERRRTIDFFPLAARQDQRGLRLGLMTLEQRRVVHRMLRETMGEEGYLRAQAIRSLESVLLATATNSTFLRQGDGYTTQLFGRPSAEAPWAFKFEGHHLSVNATLVDGVFRGTPLFLGASPAEVRSGPDTGLRVLGTQEDAARVLLASLSAEQRERGVRGEFLPGGTVPRGSLTAIEPEGLPAAAMSDGQRALLMRVVASFTSNLRPEFSVEEVRRIEAAGVGALHFLWRGDTEPGQPFSCVVVGPTVTLQLDAVEDQPGDGANHLHSLWSDPERDFGADVLARHYAEEHGEGR